MTGDPESVGEGTERFRSGEGRLLAGHFVIETALRLAQKPPAIRIEPRRAGRRCLVDAVIHGGSQQFHRALKIRRRRRNAGDILPLRQARSRRQDLFDAGIAQCRSRIGGPIPEQARQCSQQ
jgi:hypothetical protein